MITIWVGFTPSNFNKEAILPEKQKEIVLYENKR